MSESEGHLLKKEIDSLLESVANIDKTFMSGGKKKTKKTKTAEKGKKGSKLAHYGGRPKTRKSKSKSRKHDDDVEQSGGRKKVKKTKTKSKNRKHDDNVEQTGGKKKVKRTKSRNNNDELVQLGGKKNKKSKSKTSSKGRKQKREERKVNPYFEAVQKLRTYITKDANITEGLGVPMVVQLNKLLKEANRDYDKALEIYKKDKEGFKSALKKEIEARAKK